MAKLERPADTLLAPVPAVLVSCAAPGFAPNIITIAWTGTVCSDPPLISLSIRPERHSHAIISQSRELVVNIPDRSLLRATDYCGVVSGRKVDKFKETGLTALPAKLVRAPLIAEAPLHLECRVIEIKSLGSHDLFLAEVLLVQVDPGLIDQAGSFDYRRLAAFAYGNGNYYGLGELLGGYGFSQQRMRD